MSLLEKDVVHKLLEALYNDSTMSINRLAEDVDDCSASNLYKTRDLLVKDGFIKGFTIEIDPEKFGFKNHYLCIIEIDSEAMKNSFGLFKPIAEGFANELLNKNQTISFCSVLEDSKIALIISFTDETAAKSFSSKIVDSEVFLLFLFSKMDSILRGNRVFPVLLGSRSNNVNESRSHKIPLIKNETKAKQKEILNFINV